MSLVYVTPEGVTALQGGPVIATAFRLGSQYGYVPGPSDSGLRGNQVLSGSPSAPSIITPTIYKYSIALGSHLDFKFGEIALYLQNGNLFALTCLPALATISPNPLDDDGITGTIDVFIMSNGTGFIDLNNNSYMAEAGSLDMLPRPFDTSVKFYVVPDPGYPDLPLLVYRKNALWTYEGYDQTLRSQATSTTLMSVTFAGTPDLAVNTILQFSDGPFLGVSRVVDAVTQSSTHTTIYLRSPLTVEPPVGQSFILFAPPEEGTIIGSISAGGSVPFVGNQSMGGNRLTDLADAVDGGDAVSKDYLANNALLLDGTNSPSSDIDWGGNKVTNLAAPSDNTDAATKKYVDDTFSGSALNINSNISWNGNRITNLGAPQAGNDAVNRNYVDQNFINRDGSITFTNDQSMGGRRLTNLAQPVDPNDAVTRAFVENLLRGMRVLMPVRLVALTDLNVASPGPEADGTAFSLGDRVLLYNQIDPTQNGIYVWWGANQPLVRSEDMRAGTATSGSYFWATEGLTKHDTLWVLITDGFIDIGTTALTFINFGESFGLGLVRADGSTPFSGNQSMNGNKLTNVGDPTAAGDAINKDYFDSLALRRDGSATPTAPLNMDGFTVQNVGTPQTASDAATKGYVDNTALLRSGANKATGNQDWDGHRLINLGTPIAPADAATKQYVDNAKQNRLQTLNGQDSIILNPTQFEAFNLTLTGNGVLSFAPLANKSVSVYVRRGATPYQLILATDILQSSSVSYTPALQTMRPNTLDILHFEFAGSQMMLVNVEFNVSDTRRFEVLEQEKRRYTWSLSTVDHIDFTLPPGAKVWEFSVPSPTPQTAKAELLVSTDGMSYAKLAEYEVDSPTVSMEPSAFQSIDVATHFRFSVTQTDATTVLLTATL